MNNLIKIVDEMLQKFKSEYGAIKTLGKRLPVVALLFDSEKNEIIDIVNNDPSNFKNSIKSSQNHAEQILLRKNNDYNGRVELFVNIPPCVECMNKIHKNNLSRNKLNIDKVFYIDNTQFEFKRSELINKYNLSIENLNYKLLHFNPMGSDYLIEKIENIKGYYHKYINNLYSLSLIYKNFINYNNKYAYISKEEFRRCEKEFKSISIFLQKRFYYKLSTCVRINVEMLRNFYKESSKESKRISRTNSKNNNGQYFLLLDYKENRFKKEQF